MKETRFIEQNKEKWVELEKLLSDKHRDPDKASELFIQVSDDLSYARTYYGNRVVRVYLNQLTQKVFGTLLKNTVNHKKRLFNFWKEDLPGVVYHSRKEMIFSFLLFTFCMFIGALSSHYDSSFAQTILGAGYVDMTNTNIQSGDPMAVYKDRDALNMFLYIAQNNLIVAFRTFILGLFFAVGTIGSTVSNGIMVGVFQYFFISRGLFVDSALTIWMHGTMEIASIIIAGGAGLVMGKGLVFPVTFTRLQALRISARSGIKIMAGITPIIIVAALIEAFITRYTELDNIIRLSFILLQLFFIISYFVIYPIRKAKRGIPFKMNEQRMPATPVFAPELDQIKSGSAIFGDSFRTYIRLLSKYWKWYLGISTLYAISILFLRGFLMTDFLANYNWFFLKLGLLFPIESSLLISFIFLALSALTACIFGQSWRTEPLLMAPAETRTKSGIQFQVEKFIGSFILLIPLILPLFLDSGFGFLLFLIILPFFMQLQAGWQVTELSFGNALSGLLKIAFSGLARHYGAFIGIAIIGIFFLLLSDVILPLMDTSILSWNFKLDDEVYAWIKTGIIALLTCSAVFFLIPLLLTSMAYSYYSYREISEAPGLIERIRKSGLANE